MASALGKKSNVRLVGLDLIRVSDVVGATGWMPGTASLVTIGNVVPDSAHLVITAPTQAELFVEEEDTPDIILNSSGMKLSLEFAVRDMGRTTLAFGLGGTSSTATIWNAPTTAYTVKERAVEVTSKTINGKKLKFEIPRAAMSVGGDLKFSRTDSGTLAFTFNVMLPNSGVQITPCKITQV